MTKPGLFITLEGGEGVGKSTLLSSLARELQAAGQKVLTTREPGGTSGAEAIRSLLVTGTADRWSAWSEMLLLYAARKDHVDRLISPSIAQGKIVLCDRFSDSTRVYQGYAGSLGIDVVNTLDALVLGGFAPDLTLVLDLPRDVAKRRLSDRGDGESRFDRYGDAYHDAVRAGFRRLAKDHAARCTLVDASAPKATVLKNALTLITGRLVAGG